MPPTPLGPLRGLLGQMQSSEKQNQCFCFFSGKEEHFLIECLKLEARPQTPWIRFADYGPNVVMGSKTNAFTSFVEKKNIFQSNSRVRFAD
jgi:hypothetical protein